MNHYFDRKTFDFLRALAANNDRAWFQAHKSEYDSHLRQPFLRLIADLQAPLAAISPYYRADPRAQGGSLFRIYRDTRFANDKTPYKTWSGARFFHERSKQVPAPSFYLHIQPGACFLGAGIWHPEPPVQRRIREFIDNNPGSWKQATQSAGFRQRFALGGESLVRPPRGYPADHALIDDLKRKDFVAGADLGDDQVLSAALADTVIEGFRGLAPLVDYLCAALDLDFQAPP